VKGVRIRVAFYTGNCGKYYALKRLLGDWTAINVLWCKPTAEGTTEETDSGELNAQEKAVRGSCRICIPVIASDETIEIDGLVAEQQPGASIRRIVGTGASDEQTIRYYSKLVTQFPDNTCRAKLSTNFSLAYQGRDVWSEVFSQHLVLKLPAARRRLKGRPLSALHHVPAYGRRYADLTSDQRKDIDHLLKGFLINFISYGLSILTTRESVWG
jgi:inosine/xanthosine triphosphate pyrophosphatase family protein